MQRPTWKQVAKSGGLWAATLDRAGHTCDRVPLAIDLSRCIQAKWCHTGCIYAAKNSVITNYLASAEEMGVEVRPNSEAELIVQSQARPYRYVVTSWELDNEGPNPTRQPTGRSFEIECKVLILAAGAMGNSPLLDALEAGPSEPLEPGRKARRNQRRPHRGDRVRRAEGQRSTPATRIRPDLQGQPHHHDDV